MSYLQKLMMALGLEPNTASALLILLSTFLIVITIFGICAMFLLLGIRNQMIKMNISLRTFYILDSTAKINKKNGERSDDDKFIYEEKSSKDIKKLQLSDEDIKKLQAIGYKEP
jgi:hypothetical protein